MKTSNVCLIGLGLFILGFILGLTFHRNYYPCVELPVVTVERDTIVTRDTVRVPEPKPYKSVVTRRDTVKLKLTPVSNDSVRVDNVTPPKPVDTISGVNLTPAGDVVIDIERKTYKTEDYTAVVEGWRPNLVSLELYPKNTTVTETITKLKQPRWAMTVGPAFGYTDDKRFSLGAVITVGYVLWCK